MSTTINPPATEEYPEVYQPYMDQLKKDEDILHLLEKQVATLRQLLKGISEERAGESYAEGKWSMKELLQHLIEADRVFAYRALCLSRGEEASLPGWDENKYVYNSQANSRPLESILDEYELVRGANLAMFRSFTTEMINNYGTVNGRRLSLRAIIYLIAAHEQHHINILKDRYLLERQ